MHGFFTQAVMPAQPESSIDHPRWAGSCRPMCRRPARSVGDITIRYPIDHRANHGLAAGTHTVFVVASNASGNASAAKTLTFGS